MDKTKSYSVPQPNPYAMHLRGQKMEADERQQCVETQALLRPTVPRHQPACLISVPLWLTQAVSGLSSPGFQGECRMEVCSTVKSSNMSGVSTLEADREGPTEVPHVTPFFSSLILSLKHF